MWQGSPEEEHIVSALNSIIVLVHMGDFVMDIFEAIKTRRSIRVYKKHRVPEDLILKVIDAARYAPSGANLQPWKFIVVTDPEMRKKIGAGARFYFIKSHHVSEAPCLIVCLADLKKSKWAIIDTSMACQNLMLAAHASGLATCFIGIFDEEQVKKELEIPDNYKVIGLITLGFAAQNERMPARIPLKKIIYWERFGSETAFKRARDFLSSGPVTIFDKVLRTILRFRR